MLGYLPYKWSQRTGTVEFDRSSRRKVVFGLQVLLYWTYLLYLAVRAFYITYLKNHRVTASERIELQYMVVGHFGPVPFQVCSLCLYGRHHFVINQFLWFHRALRHEWKVSRGRAQYKSVNKFFRGLICLGLVNTFSNVSLIWRKPRAVNLITAEIPIVENW